VLNMFLSFVLKMLLRILFCTGNVIIILYDIVSVFIFHHFLSATYAS
jgi:hypothetical protein